MLGKPINFKMSDLKVTIKNQPKSLVILHLLLIVFYLSFFLLPVMYLKIESEYRIFIQIGFYIALIMAGFKIFYELRYILLYTLETLFNLKYSIKISGNGIFFHNLFRQENYAWNQIEEIVRESLLHENKYEINIVTENRIFYIFDDSNWSQFEILKATVPSIEIINKNILYYYKDPESGVVIDIDDINEIPN